MPSRTTLLATVAALSVFGFSACKTVYSDTFSYRKNKFQAPVPKKTAITPPPTGPNLLEGAMPNGGLPGEMPGGIPGMPGAPAAPGDGMAPGLPVPPDAAAPVPGAPPVPPAPAVPGVN